MVTCSESVSGTLPDRPDENPDLDREEECEYSQEKEESGLYRSDADAGHSGLHRQQTLDCPRLPSDLCHDPAGLAGEVDKRNGQHADPQEPSVLLQGLPPDVVEGKDHHKQQKASQPNHHTERPVDKTDRRNQFLLGGDVAVAEVPCVLHQSRPCGGGQFGVAPLGLPVGSERGKGGVASGHHLGGGRMSRSVSVHIAVQNVLYARHMSVKVAGGEEGKHTRNLNPRDNGERRAGATSLKSFGGSEFHRLVLGDMNRGPVSGEHQGHRAHNAQYIDWIEDRLYSEFNYTCVDTLEDFNHINEKAVTKEGLIKAKGGKHEKDDRQEINRREHYVLGWDNREKIAAIKKEYDNLCRQVTAKNKEIKEFDNKRKETEERKETFSRLLDFEKFDYIDWQSYSVRINEKKEEKKQLESTNDRVKTLQEQLEKVKLRITDIETQNQNLSRQQGMLDKAKKDTEERCSENSNALALMDSVDVDEFENSNPDLLLVGLADIETRLKSMQNDIDNKIRNKQAEKNRKEYEAKSKIIKFKNPTEEITTKFRDWRSDVNSLPDSVEFISEYQTLLKKLNEEALPSFEKKFNKYLQERLINNIYTFRQFFKDWESLINKTINQLNSYLKDINFNVYPETYIQLESSKKRNVNINEFVQMLEKAIPNLREINSTIDGQRIHFEKNILPLMQRLQDEQWRKEVMDVRARFSYKAVEYYKADDLKRNTYESMGQLSGGEKAQLTYTILGSAIAYQFGLTKHGCDSSFRFIAIDEAFRAQDEDKARYLISLCKQLHLQLLVVTPSDNIHIVENDISYVHYVERKGNASVLYNMPINQFKEERQKTLESK